MLGLEANILEIEIIMISMATETIAVDYNQITKLFSGVKS